MLNHDIDLYFFSGTGNTYLIAKEIKAVFDQKGYNVTLYRLEKSNPIEINMNHTIGIGVTAAFFSTYPLVWNFIKNLPPADGTPLFFFDSLGGFAGGLNGPVKKVVTQKGYTPIGAEDFVMPSNFSNKPMNQEELTEKLRKNKTKAFNFVCALIKGNASWPTTPILGPLLYQFNMSIQPPVRMRSKFRISCDQQKCIKCGLCAKACSTNNIQMQEYPQFSDQCEFCMRCFAYCPGKAISFKGMSKIQYHSVPLADLLLEKE